MDTTRRALAALRRKRHGASWSLHTAVGSAFISSRISAFGWRRIRGSREQEASACGLASGEVEVNMIATTDWCRRRLARLRASILAAIGVASLMNRAADSARAGDAAVPMPAKAPAPTAGLDWTGPMSASISARAEAALAPAPTWRLPDAGPRARGCVRHGRHPKPYTNPALRLYPRHFRLGIVSGIQTAAARCRSRAKLGSRRVIPRLMTPARRVRAWPPSSRGCRTPQ
jgi:hypothetical protein